MASKSEAILKDFINYCADPTCPLPTADEGGPYCAAVRHLAGQLMHSHQEELGRLCDAVDLAFDIDFFLHSVFDIVFDDRKSVGRLISVIAFAGALSRQPGNDNAALCDCISGFIDDNLDDWLQRADVWNQVCELHHRNVQVGDSDWRHFCLKEDNDSTTPAYHVAFAVCTALFFCCMLL